MKTPEETAILFPESTPDEIPQPSRTLSTRRGTMVILSMFALSAIIGLAVWQPGQQARDVQKRNDEEGATKSAVEFMGMPTSSATRPTAASVQPQNATRRISAARRCTGSSGDSCYTMCVCEGWGDPHFDSSFMSSDNFDFMNLGAYNLATTTNGQVKAQLFNIQAGHGGQGSTHGANIGGLALKYMNSQVTVTINPRPDGSCCDVPTVRKSNVETCVFNEVTSIISWQSQNLIDNSNSNTVHTTNENGHWNQWRISDAGHGRVFIKSHHSKYLADHGHSVLTYPNTGTGEQWTLEDAGDGKVCMKSFHYNRYLRHRSHDGAVVLEHHCGAEEKWTIPACAVAGEISFIADDAPAWHSSSNSPLVQLPAGTPGFRVQSMESTVNLWIGLNPPDHHAAEWGARYDHLKFKLDLAGASEEGVCGAGPHGRHRVTGADVLFSQAELTKLCNLVPGMRDCHGDPRPSGHRLQSAEEACPAGAQRDAARAACSPLKNDQSFFDECIYDYCALSPNNAHVVSDALDARAQTVSYIEFGLGESCEPEKIIPTQEECEHAVQKLHAGQLPESGTSVGASHGTGCAAQVTTVGGVLGIGAAPAVTPNFNQPAGPNLMPVCRNDRSGDSE